MATYEEYLKFKMNKPEAKREFRTIEIYHPKFSQVWRLVQDFDSYNASLESTAPRNAGQEVEFLPFAGRITEPAERNDGDRTIQIDVGDLDGVIQDEMDRLDGKEWMIPIEVIYRKYWSDDNTSPAVNPLYLFALPPSFNETEGDIPVSATINASDSDLSQKAAGIIYTTTDFPGLS